MRRVWTGVVVLLAILGIAALVAIPKIMYVCAETRLRSAIDESHPHNLAAITELVKQGHDVRTIGSQGDMIAMVAAFWNDTQLLQAAIDGGVDPNTADRSFGNSAIINAMMAPSVEPTRILSKAGADVNHQTKSGDTALMYAVRNAQYDIIPLLVEVGANVELKNANGETALSFAHALQQAGPRPLRPDLTRQDFVNLLQNRVAPLIRRMGSIEPPPISSPTRATRDLVLRSGLIWHRTSDRRFAAFRHSRHDPAPANDLRSPAHRDNAIATE